MTSKQNSKSGRVTIDDLVVMISHMEDRIVSRIENVENGLKSLETKMNFGFTGLQNQMDNIYLNYK